MAQNTGCQGDGFAVDNFLKIKTKSFTSDMQCILFTLFFKASIKLGAFLILNKKVISK